ncbi:hypothetical protein SDC9_88393 [bioreactor metagenome]|uniref:Uncharacterized protein n=1 Tax=bioreactor metagenome TaxID=1076179 RepID=A0A644ZVY7_9ZZZZ
MDQRGHLARRVELDGDPPSAGGGGDQGELSRLADPVGGRDQDGDVLARAGVGHRGVVGRLEADHRDVPAGDLLAGDPPRRERLVVGLRGVEVLLHVDQRVGHQPVDLGPGLDHLGGGGVTEVGGNGAEEVLVDGRVLVLLQPQRSVLVCDPRQHRLRVGVRVLQQPGRESDDRAGQRLGLLTGDLVGAAEHAVQQVGTRPEHPAVELRGDEGNALGDDRCGGRDDRAGGVRQHGGDLLR